MAMVSSPHSPPPAAPATPHSSSGYSQNEAATSQRGSSPMDTREEHSSPHPNGDHPSAEGIYSLDGDILYKAPPLFIPEVTDDGKLAAPTSPFAPLSVPRPAYRPPGTNLPKHTDYTKHANVFDELQSSLFPPGTLESLHINMSTPQEVMSDDSLFAESVEEKDSTGLTNKHGVDEHISVSIKTEADSYVENGEEFDKFINKVSTTLGLNKDSVPRHRLYKEFRVLAKATPQMDPSIDSNIYQLPHDHRIDYIPCPKLRAQMIVHQHRYDADELFQLLISEAICHGSPMKRDNWQLPEAFFDRFGFLLGLELERIRNKKWPPKAK
ncbi:hypothetical protein BGX31_003126 [Mortierella sp. GBA43]|nr:hypothetical protein BGX31_003126 [Mortierella sp. GBA43]